MQNNKSDKLAAKARQRTVGVFLKAPVPGRVKTRIAAEVGPQAACLLYCEMVDCTFAHLAMARPGTNIVAFYDGRSLEACERWLACADRWAQQADGDLGARLEAAFLQEASSDSAMLVVGTDCPELDPDLISQAFDALENVDVVLGPAGDGGYYLVGCRRRQPGLFEDIRWSDANTLADQLFRARQLGLRTALLPVREDIDTWDDWLRYLERTGRKAAPLLLPPR